MFMLTKAQQSPLNSFDPHKNALNWQRPLPHSLLVESYYFKTENSGLLYLWVVFWGRETNSVDLKKQNKQQK